MPGMTSFGQAICTCRHISVCMRASQADTEGALQVVNWLVRNHVDKLSGQTFPFDLTAMCVAGGPPSLKSQPTIARVNNGQMHKGGSVCTPDHFSTFLNNLSSDRRLLLRQDFHEESSQLFPAP